MQIKKVAIFGFGKIGELLATMLDSLNIEIFIIDNKELNKCKFKHLQSNLNSDSKVVNFLKENKIDSVISCLPFYLNKKVAGICYELKLNYFDLTEDIATTDFVRKLSLGSKKNIFMPQNGLAPGFISIIAQYLIEQTDKAYDLNLRVGALPLNPIGSLGYACNWSVEGLINEYIEDSQIIENGKIIKVPSMERLEKLKINGNEYEAFLTSGGVGTILESMKGKIKNLNYKSIRYIGHLDKMRFLIQEMKLKEDRKLLCDLIRKALPPDDNDHVLIHASVTGKFGNETKSKEVTADIKPLNIFSKKYTAISWTTAASMAAIIELINTKKIKKTGFIETSSIKLEDFFATQMGKLFLDNQINL